MIKEIKPINVAAADLYARQRLSRYDKYVLNIEEAAFDLLLNDPPREYIPEIVSLLREAIVPRAKRDHFIEDGLHTITVLNRWN